MEGLAVLRFSIRVEMLVRRRLVDGLLRTVLAIVCDVMAIVEISVTAMA